ncbi:hypothetical protein CLAIMM_12789 isoform 2 [Cladophialophora immunda]|nr:hypothetical protein CLAIMM_12789 isoform 2 [Cladophialophora immunda]
MQAPKTLVSRLMVTLDSLTPSRPDDSTTHITAFPNMLLDDEDTEDQNAIINQALISAVHAFSARWLPVSRFGRGNASDVRALTLAKEYFLERIWERAHKDVLRVLTRPSYRSILALYLFGTTPASTKNKQRCIADHCFEMSLRQYFQLRARSSTIARQHGRRNENNSQLQDTSSTAQAHKELKHLEDTAYWFGVVIDGSRSLTRCQPSVLLPGLQGEAQVWSPIKDQTEMFRTTYGSIPTSKAPLTDEIVMTMIQHGAACKTLFWKSVSRIQDYLFYQTVESPLEVLVNSAAEEMARFEDVFDPFFNQCARDWILLSQKSRLSYFILALHFHLGVLILVDVLETLHEVATETFIDIGACRLSSTRAVVNLTNLMLLQGDADAGAEASSIFLKDPYPEHTRNGISRASYSVLHLFRGMSLTKQVAEIMAAPLFAALGILSQVSYTAEESLRGLRKAYSDADLAVMTGVSTYLVTAPPDLDLSITPEMFEDETVRELDLAEEDPNLVDKTIGRHEAHEISYDFDCFDLEGIDFTSVMHEWAFEGCFSSG